VPNPRGTIVPKTSAEKSRDHRLKDVEEYRRKKRALTKLSHHRKKRCEYMRVWRENNRDRHNQLARESHQRNKHKHVHKVRERLLKSKYGITTEQYEKMLSSQNGVCFICLKVQGDGKRKLAIDHCHKTGKVRGLLCCKCNGNLGWLDKHRDRIEGYLTKFS